MRQRERFCKCEIRMCRAWLSHRAPRRCSTAFRRGSNLSNSLSQSDTRWPELELIAWTLAPLRLWFDSALAAEVPNRCRPIRRRGCWTSFASLIPPASMTRRPRPRGLTALREDRETKPPPGESRSAALFKAQAAAQLAQRGDHPCPVSRAAGLVLDQPLHHFPAAGPVRRRRRRFRRGSDPPACHRPLRRHGRWR